MSLKVHYSGADQTAEISLTPTSAAWADIVRAFSDKGAEIELGANSLRMPWWNFLACRKALAHVLEQHRLDLEATPEAERLLLDALRKEKAFTSPESLAPVDPETVKQRLKDRGFRRPLTEHQLRNICRLVALPAGATFSVPGAGKTTEALAYFTFKKDASDGLLVVAPKNAFAAWEEQTQECFETPFPVIRLHGGAAAITEEINRSKSPCIFLITYQQLAIVKHVIAAYLTSNSSFVFLDESHRMKKGADGVLGQAVLNLSHLPKGKLILSGTPLPNALVDLIPQFDFLYPEIRADENNVQEYIRPIYVRTTKAELNLPPVTRRYHTIGMSSAQRKLYDLLRHEEARQNDPRLRSFDRNFLRAVGRSVTRLLQVASNPALLANVANGDSAAIAEALSEGDCPKITHAVTRARELAQAGKKLIIWTTFIPNVELLALRLRDLGADYIHGGVEAGSEEDSDSREYKIKQFHDNAKKWVLIANPAACSEGISLHKACHNALYLDRNFNAAQYLQSEDRIHRLGLAPGTVTDVEILVSPDSIDEIVRRRLEAKVARMAKVLDDVSLSIEPTTTDPDEDGIEEADALAVLDHLKAP